MDSNKYIQEGKLAFRSNIDILQCPYSEIEAKYWAKGWLLAVNEENRATDVLMNAYQRGYDSYTCERTNVGIDLNNPYCIGKFFNVGIDFPESGYSTAASSFFLNPHQFDRDFEEKSKNSILSIYQLAKKYADGHKISRNEKVLKERSMISKESFQQIVNEYYQYNDSLDHRISHKLETCANLFYLSFIPLGYAIFTPHIAIYFIGEIGYYASFILPLILKVKQLDFARQLKELRRPYEHDWLTLRKLELSPRNGGMIYDELSGERITLSQALDLLGESSGNCNQL